MLSTRKASTLADLVSFGSEGRLFELVQQTRAYFITGKHGAGRSLLRQGHRKAFYV